MNSVQLVGRLTRDPELKSVGETSVTKFSLAVNGRVKNKTTGEYEDDPMFIDCECWGNLGSMISEKIKKGDGVGLVGELRFDTWDDKNGGGKRSKHFLRVDKFNFLPGKGAEGGGTSDTTSGAAKPKRGRPAKSAESAPVAQGEANPADDSIPF